MPSMEGFKDGPEAGLNKKNVVPAKLSKADDVDNKLMAEVADQVDQLGIEA